MKKILIVLLAVVATSLGPLAAPARAQIALPGLSAGGDAKKAPAAEQVPKRERILAQIEEAERRRNEALRLRPTYTGEDAVHATEVQHLLDRLTVVERDKLKRLNELEMAQKAMPPSIETWPVVRELSGPPPYSALRVDALRDALDSQNDKLQAMSARWQSLEAEKIDLTRSRQRSAEAVRLAEDRLARSTESEGEHQQARRARELAALQQQVSDAELVAQSMGQEALKLQMAAQRRLIDELDRVVERVLPHQRLSEADMAFVRARAKAGAEKLKAEIDASVSAHNKRLAERDRLVRDGAKNAAGSEERNLRLRFLDDALETDLVVLRGLSWLQLIGQQWSEAIELRFLSLGGDAQAREAALPALQKIKSGLDDRLKIAKEQRRALNLSIREQEGRLASAVPGSIEYRYTNEMLGLLQKRNLMFDRVEAFVANFERQIGRWERDLGGGGASSLGERLTAGWRAATRWLSVLWHYELFSVEDSVEVDGSRVPVSYGVTVDKSVGALLLFVLGYWALARLSRVAQRVLVTRFGIEAQLAQVIRRWLVILFTLGLVVFVLNLARIPLTVFAFLGGALAIGVGFGTQTIIKNLISGIIILFERKIRVGDIVNIGETTGNVVAVDLRATTISGFDGVEALVPNSTFLENTVTNWTYSSPSIRRELRIGVAYGSDTRLAASLLAQCAREHAHVLRDPIPEVFFEDYGDSALQFVLVYWVQLGLQVGPRRVDSDLRHAIGDRFAEAGIGVPFPQRDIRLEVNGPLPVQVSHGEPGR
ncbi:MAG: mechanosensitive ion channel [Propionivibrio sp.]